MDSPIYFDYAAATPTDERVILAMSEATKEFWANPASAHILGRKAQEKLEQARQTIANFIGAENPSEIILTSCGSESNTLALVGTARANRSKGRHIITTAIEHASILNACKVLEKDGWQVTYLSVDKNGQISLDELEHAITEQTILFSIHYGNSELGTLIDLAKISDICQKHNVLLHIDACQALSHEPLNVQAPKIDLLTFNGGKLYGPKGVGVLYVRQNTSIFPIIYGGGQQQSLRSGTENVAGAVGLATACEIAVERRAEDAKHIAQLRNSLQNQLEQLSNVTINAAKAKRLPNHLSVTFNQLENIDLVQKLSDQGFCVSAGSACSATSIIESHVLIAIGLNSRQINATLRITLGRSITEKDCQALLATLKALV